MIIVKKEGFTLVELLVTVVISSLLIAAVFSIYVMQRKTHTGQEVQVEMHQNLRAGVDTIKRDLRMVGYDPNNTGEASITEATETEFAFSRIEDEDTDTTISIDYNLYDAYGDGVSDFGRAVGGVRRCLIENVSHLEFYYTLADGTSTSSPSAAELSKIRSIQVSILVRANRGRPNYINGKDYTPASGNTWDLNGGGAAGNSAGDNLHRTLIISSVLLRNMRI